MALTRAQLLSGNTAQGSVLSGQVQGVKQGAGIAIAADGTISVNSATVTGLVKLNNTGAFNGYVWPATDGASGEFLKTDGAGNLAWATTQGFAVVTVSPLPPSPIDEGELWYDCTTGTLKVYQNCTLPNGWTSTAQAGLNPDPANTTAAPPFSSGNGTQGTPYVSSVTTVGSGGAVFVVNVVTITGLAPFQYVPIVDLNAVANGGRFGFSNYYANSSGILVFQTIFNDAPASPSGTNYTANIKVGNASVYVTAVVNVVSALTLNSPGSISGLPNVGVTLTYTTGTASGGTSPYTYTWKWKDSTGTVLQNNGATYPVVIGNLGKTITVELTATDAALQTATGTTTPTAAVTKASFPSGTWNPTPSGAMNTSNPGTSSGPWNGPAGTVITATGCVEVSKDGISYFPTVTVTSPDVLYQRWKDTPACGQANTGSPLTGTVSDGTSENSYSLTINRQPSPAIADISDTNIALNATTTKGIASPVAGLNSPAYITLGAGSTGTGIQVSTDNVTFVTPPAAPSTSVTIANAQTLYIRQIVGAVTNTGYTAVVKVGDADGVIADTVTYTATTVTSAVFPATTFAPAGGPNASPANTLFGTLDGISTATWGAGATNLTATGSLEFQVNGGGFTQASTPVADTNTVELRWNAAAAVAATATGSLTGTLTNSTYTNTYTLSVNKLPTAYTWTDVTSGAPLSTLATSNLITLAGINCPAELTYTPDGTTPLTSVEASIDGGAFVAIPTSGTGLTINPGIAAGTAANTLRIRGITGATNSTAYKIVTNIGKGASVVTDEWSVTTTGVTPTINQPTILTPNNNAVDVNPALNSPSAVTITSNAYVGNNSPGAHASSDWLVLDMGADTTGVNTSAITASATPLNYSGGTTWPANALRTQNFFSGSTTLLSNLGTAAPAGSGTTRTVTFTNLPTVTSQVRVLVYNGAATNATISVNGGAAQTVAQNNPSGALFTFTGITSVNSITYTYGGGNFDQGALGYMEIDGVVVADNPTTTTLTLTDNTGLSSMTVSDSVRQSNATAKTFSNTLTSTNGFAAGNPATNAFDGSSATYAICSGGGGNLVWDASSYGITVNSSLVINNFSGGSNADYTLKVNGTTVINSYNVPSGQSGFPTDLAASLTKPFTLSSVEIIAASPSAVPAINTLTVDGVVLIDGQYLPSGTISAKGATSLTLSSPNGTWTVGQTATDITAAPVANTLVGLRSTATITAGGGTSTLTIAGANTDGFAVGNPVCNGLTGGSAAAGTISSVNATTVVLTGVTGSFANGQNLFRGVSAIVAATADTVNLVSYPVLQALLATSRRYSEQVRYKSATTTSPWSGFSSFDTASAFTPAPGSALNGGFFGGQINDGGIIYNLIVGPAATAQNTTGLAYKTTASADSPAATFQNLVYGFPASQLANGASHLAFQFARSLSISGYSDWYIPAKNELEILYYNLKPGTTSNDTSSGINPNAVPARASNYTAGNPAQTTSTLFQTGNAQAFSELNYWSSTEFSGNANNAWRDDFSVGGQSSSFTKTASLPARAIRREYANAPVAIGAAFGGGYFAGQYRDGGVTYNLIVAPKATGEYGPGVGTIQYNIANTSDTNPNSQNTVYGKLASDQFNDASHPAFQWSRGLTIATFSDWYIPAYDELNIISLNLGPLWTTSTAFQTGGAEALSATPNYWSATEVPANTARAWAFRMDTYGTADTSKSNGISARAVRRVAA